ncbi:MAG: hypothetical protein AAGD07_14770 [Planctomycetota bacterium]
MIRDAMVYVPVWLALLGWFTGSLARFCDRGEPQSKAGRIYRASWFIGSLMIVLHILASYGLVHDWSHQAAIEATAEESERVTGIRAGWGVYVNFAFATIWLAYSIAMIVQRFRMEAVDGFVFWFTAAIVFFATVVFETGLVRFSSIAGFFCLGIAWLRLPRSDRDPHLGSSRSGS